MDVERRLRDDLHRAELIQRALLPYSVPALQGFALRDHIAELTGVVPALAPTAPSASGDG